MRAFKVVAVIGLTGLLLLTGCGSKEPAERAESQSENASSGIGVSFNAKSGLLVPAETAKFIGLEFVDVAEQKIASTSRFIAQVYRIDSAGTNATAWGSAFVNKDEIEGLSDGQSLTIKRSDGEPLAGKLKGLARRIGKQSDAIELIVEISNALQQLRLGDHVEVVALIGKAKVGIAIPCTALLQTLEGDFVYTVSGERLVRTAVKVGVLNDKFAEITDGLYEGDKVAVKPAMTLWLAELQSIRGGKACADGH
jgi:hypothetical protein